MKAIINGQLVSEEELQLSIHNRAFQYGDGFFETMLVNRRTVKLQDYHFLRIKDGLKMLDIAIDDLSNASLQNSIKQLCHENEFNAFAKAKLIIWRSQGGTYTPTKKRGEWLIMLSEMNKPSTTQKNNVGISQSIFNIKSVHSELKSVNAISYVLAGQEMKKKGFDDIIITSTDGHISECLISNIFWVKGNQVFTPSLNTGCINGISRRYLINKFPDFGSNIIESEAGVEDLLQADHIFTTNATGVSHIRKLENKEFLPFSAIEEIFRPY